MKEMGKTSKNSGAITKLGLSIVFVSAAMALMPGCSGTTVKTPVETTGGTTGAGAGTGSTTAKGLSFKQNSETNLVGRGVGSDPKAADRRVIAMGPNGNGDLYFIVEGTSSLGKAYYYNPKVKGNVVGFDLKAGDGSNSSPENGNFQASLLDAAKVTRIVAGPGPNAVFTVTGLGYPTQGGVVTVNESKVEAVYPNDGSKFFDMGTGRTGKELKNKDATALVTLGDSWIVFWGNNEFPAAHAKFGSKAIAKAGPIGTHNTTLLQFTHPFFNGEIVAAVASGNDLYVSGTVSALVGSNNPTGTVNKVTVTGDLATTVINLAADQVFGPEQLKFKDEQENNNIRHLAMANGKLLVGLAVTPGTVYGRRSGTGGVFALDGNKAVAKACEDCTVNGFAVSEDGNTAAIATDIGVLFYINGEFIGPTGFSANKAFTNEPPRAYESGVIGVAYSKKDKNWYVATSMAGGIYTIGMVETP